ncbi:hypothetical protein AB0L44_36880 [Nonomuraea wenchangensis]|uniref:hypothetical protein n=1 Tax=Nonomuraea wenchangensis TaxID=568860 RepID=UPI0034321BB2
MSVDLVSATEPRTASSLASMLGDPVVAGPEVDFQSAEQFVSGKRTLVVHAAVTPGARSTEAARIREALRHHVAWLRAVQALPPESRRGFACVLLTDGDGAGAVVGAAVAQLVSAIHADFDTPARHYAVEVMGPAALPAAAHVARALVGEDPAGALAGRHLAVDEVGVRLISGPIVADTVTLTRGWTADWLTKTLEGKR